VISSTYPKWLALSAVLMMPIFVYSPKSGLLETINTLQRHEG